MAPAHRFAPLLRPELIDLAPYAPEQPDGAVRLDSNEAPALLSAEARDRLARAAAEVEWQRYPDPRAARLRAALAERTGVRPEEVLAGVGSDEIISLLLTALCNPRRRSQPASVVSVSPTFVMYKTAARARGMQMLDVPLDEAWDLDVRALGRAVTAVQPNLVFVASPNNPTGNRMSIDRIAELCTLARDAVVVVDEAYVDYADGDQLELRRRHSNVVVLRTLSKVGFAALRVGWLVAAEELVCEIDKARMPYNLGSVQQRLAEIVVREMWDEVRRTVETVRSERARVAARVAAIDGFAVGPSEANFLWVRAPAPAEAVHAALRERGVLVRAFAQAGSRLADRLRVTIGSAADNDRFLEALESWAAARPAAPAGPGGDPADGDPAPDDPTGGERGADAPATAATRETGPE